ncbi:YeeE/YedE family protein [Pseudoalteromonas sp. SR45-4]|uniref:YeeE/YedE family protein n=1 Tax=Pseudoalteromonas sp. SR45-4 TaxID=2760929 RepID=UPI0015F9F3EE|nr:YeeE/YedE family protein [Pseudoalteromonas sp. SR45-4]MBB1369633.1 YeeE/YedE family protein [Pseudoalteromonas sp. SR45-4]
MNKKQAILGSAIAILSILLGALFLETSSLFLRLLLGLALGFALAKGSIGFAGSINRAYRRGSTQLLQTLMFMFVITAIINAGLLVNTDSTSYNLWVNPINLGLIIGGVMFGAGMSLSSCCATGMMVEMVSDVPRALTTLVFFGAGVFFGFPLQATQSWITQSVISTSSYAGQGVYLPDLFSWGPLNGYFIAILVTIAFALIVVVLAKIYENYRQKSGSYLGVDGEIARQNQLLHNSTQQFTFFSTHTYKRWIGNMWEMRTSALVIAIIFGVMMASTGSGWGASTPFGIWFGKLVMQLGISANDIANYTLRPEVMFTTGFFDHAISVQNFAIMLGTLIAVLLMGKFSFSFKINHSAKQFALFALGGLLMGFGTRFANGCNVGALFTPIANFSLSGWVYLIFLLLGGILGNKLQHAVIK